LMETSGMSEDKRCIEILLGKFLPFDRFS